MMIKFGSDGWVLVGGYRPPDRCELLALGRVLQYSSVGGGFFWGWYFSWSQNCWAPIFVGVNQVAVAKCKNYLRGGFQMFLFLPLPGGKSNLINVFQMG